MASDIAHVSAPRAVPAVHHSASAGSPVHEFGGPPSARRRRRRWRCPPTWGAIAISASVAIGLSACGVGDEGPPSLAEQRRLAVDAPCAERVTIADGSGSSRADDRQVFVAGLIVTQAMSAAVCQEPFAAYLVAGPGDVETIVSSDDLAGLDLTGPNARVRSTRFGDDEARQVRDLVFDRLRSAYERLAPESTSITAMLALAADQVTASAELTIVTDGVNNDGLSSLNRDLEPGDGAAAADDLPATSVPANRITFSGVGFVAADGPAPSPTWQLEITAFVEALCERTGALRCEILGEASIGQVLR